MRRGFICKKEILDKLKKIYDKIVEKEYNGNYLSAIQNFDTFAEATLRDNLLKFYKNQRSRDQAWKTCKGSLYEYAVFKVIEQIIIEDNELNSMFMVTMSDKDLYNYKDQVAIKNWTEIFPDADILIVEKNKNLVRVIISCKTSLRERLTETAFWKREIEKTKNEKILLIFMTTDKDDELKIDTNRYILLHVIDYTFITDRSKYTKLLESYKKKYGNREDFQKLISKVRFIADIKDFLHTL
ncbi:hypothetical protein THC_1097 [Caldimicrobium thiodismutans]|jgi:type II restriction enzyme|uniref:BsaWI restriction endonuclease type 2 domain-containing protein n=1 Tax=Caldimicrobium thiodismutans TaxID=1653476 RepID=A0A0U5AN42_9BACT|nr:BsaWI family type II restriction enzyme [Caldimicrobium thiodismutans]BAU23476.1 hypothetical protein THC_1097 [Caldimicrobium thiodismutans]